MLYVFAGFTSRIDGAIKILASVLSQDTTREHAIDEVVV